MEPKEQIRQFILTELVNDKAHADIADSDSLLESGIVDSLGIMKLIGFLEDNLSVQVNDDELIPENFASIETITNLVASKS
jgi:acyl carrier protein